MNGNEKGDREYAGVAIVIRNDLGKYVEDVIPHSPRIAEIRLKGVAPISITTVYAPQSGRTVEEKEAFYKELREIIKQVPRKGHS